MGQGLAEWWGMRRESLTVAITSDDASGAVAGCRVYVRNLVTHLAHRFPDDSYVLVSGRHPEAPWQPDLPNVRAVVLPLGFRALQRGVWPFLGGPVIERFTGPIDVLHNTLTTTSVPAKAPVVVTVHDLYPERFPERYPWRTHHGRRQLLDQANGGPAIAISRATRDDAVHLGGIPAERMRVVHHGVPDHGSTPADDTSVPATAAGAASVSEAAIGAVRQRYELDVPYLVTICRIDPRKNLTNLIDAYGRYRAAGGLLELVVAGGDGTGADEVRSAAAALGPAAPTHFLGYVPDDDVAPLLAGADMYVYPSAYEGFGLPLLEAMAAGVPIVASGTSSLPEVGGDAALYVDPDDPDSIATGLLRVERDRDLRSALIAAAPHQLARFDWDRAAEETRAVYVQAIDGTR